jgi:hypothetical protein
MTEAELLTQVGKLCESYHLLWYHVTDSTKNMGRMGIPDLTIVGSKLIMAELKTNWNNLSGVQTTWKYRLLAAKVEHHVWRPRDLDDGTIESVLSGIEYTYREC